MMQEIETTIVANVWEKEVETTTEALMLGRCDCETIDSQKNTSFNCVVNNQTKDITDAST